MREIESLRKKKPKDFWQFFKPKLKGEENNISVQEFRDFFCKISNKNFIFSNDESEIFCENHNFDNLDTAFPELDKLITTDEVRSAIKSLKRGKACGIDCLLN